MIMYKNKSTSIIFGLVGSGYGYYKGVQDYDYHVNNKNVKIMDNNEINKIFEKKILLNTLMCGGIFSIIGIYPIITFPIITSLYTYDKLFSENKFKKDGMNWYKL